MLNFLLSIQWFVHSSKVVTMIWKNFILANRAEIEAQQGVKLSSLNASIVYMGFLRDPRQ